MTDFASLRSQSVSISPSRWREGARPTPAQRHWQRVASVSSQSTRAQSVPTLGSLGRFQSTSSAPPRPSPQSPISSGNVELARVGSRSAQSMLEKFATKEGDHAPKERSADAIAVANQRMHDQDVIDQVIQFYEEAKAKSSFSSNLKYLFGPKVQLPSIERLRKVVDNAFPRRMDLPVLVCDVKATSADVTVTRVGEIEQYWKERPPDVILRWIHAPLGQGLLHSSVEDMFLHDEHRGKPFAHAGTAGFPFVQLDSVHFRERKDLKYLRQVGDVLRKIDPLTETLNETLLEGDSNETLERDLLWREMYLGVKRNYWDYLKADLPLELSESLSFQGPLRLKDSSSGELEHSSIGSSGDQYDGAKLVVAPFRFFHRRDGTLLTLSAASGVDQLHKDFHVDLREPLLHRLKCDDSSVVGQMLRWLQETGASEWHEHTVEWFMVYLMSELGVAPQNSAGGRSVLSLISVIQNKIIDLKRKRYDTWQRRKTVDLVKEYLICMDDLKLLGLSYTRKVTLFEQLIKDLRAHDAVSERVVKNPDAQTAIDRAEWAIRQLKEDALYAEHMYDDIEQALNSLFKLRSIEQNESAMVTESQNKALFVFTGVTVVFLPLSFFTSYYGMNIEGIRDTNWTEDAFWQVCGSATFAIIAMIITIAARYGRRHTRNKSWNWRPLRTKKESQEKDVAKMV